MNCDLTLPLRLAVVAERNPNVAGTQVNGVTVTAVTNRYVETQSRGRLDIVLALVGRCQGFPVHLATKQDNIGVTIAAND